MNFINYFKIRRFCINNSIKNYKINSNGTVDVNVGKNFYSGTNLGTVDISSENLKKIPIKFGRVNTHFNCDINNLSTLENSPEYVSGEFSCRVNKLTTLLGGPKSVGIAYYCNNNNLKDLYGFPQIFDGKFNIGHTNPVAEIVTLISPEYLRLVNKPIALLVSLDDRAAEINDNLNKTRNKFIKFLNEYQVIRNGDTIIESRLMDALYEVNIKEMPKTSFKNYKLI